MAEKKMLLLGTVSWCHRARSIIVRSRQGGFVTQNCEVCGRPRSLSKAELPVLACGRCGVRLEAFIDYAKNYAYRCTAYGTPGAELASLVPDWNDLFSYWGFAIDSDFVTNPTPLSQQQAEAILHRVRASRPEQP